MNSFFITFLVSRTTLGTIFAEYLTWCQLPLLCTKYESSLSMWFTTTERASLKNVTLRREIPNTEQSQLLRDIMSVKKGVVIIVYLV